LLFEHLVIFYKIVIFLVFSWIFDPFFPENEGKRIATMVQNSKV